MNSIAKYQWSKKWSGVFLFHPVFAIDNTCYSIYYTVKTEDFKTYCLRCVEKKKHSCLR